MTAAAPPLLVGLRIAGAGCLVVGGGVVATRRVERLLAADAAVTVVSPEASVAIRSSGATWVAREYRRSDLHNMVLVVTATGVSAVDAAVVADATAAGIPVNDATAADRSTVVFPAVAAAGPVTVGVSTSGLSPALARWVAARIEKDLHGVPELAGLMEVIRAEMRAAGRSTDHPGWERALDSGILDLIRRGDATAAANRLRDHLGLADGFSPEEG